MVIGREAGGERVVPRGTTVNVYATSAEGGVSEGAVPTRATTGNPQVGVLCTKIGAWARAPVSH